MFYPSTLIWWSFRRRSLNLEFEGSLELWVGTWWCRERHWIPCHFFPAPSPPIHLLHPTLQGPWDMHMDTLAHTTKVQPHHLLKWLSLGYLVTQRKKHPGKSPPLTLEANLGVKFWGSEGGDHKFEARETKRSMTWLMLPRGQLHAICCLSCFLVIAIISIHTEIAPV